jgi:pimeloyl-ACP methyl ester carboxylesterase
MSGSLHCRCLRLPCPLGRVVVLVCSSLAVNGFHAHQATRHERLDHHVPTAHDPDRRLSALYRRHPGGTPPLLFLNGGFGSLQNWDRVIQRLAGKYRTVRFDARARGKSATSADYSVRGAVDDVSRVIEATGIQRPILVGWSQGATIAVLNKAPDTVVAAIEDVSTSLP